MYHQHINAVSRMQSEQAARVYGWSKLHYYASIGDVDRTQFLPVSGADLNLKTDYSGQDYESSARQTPLMLAAKYRHPHVVKVLLHHGCDVDIKDWNGKTALDYSVMSGCEDITEMLLKAGAEVKRKWRISRNGLLFKFDRSLILPDVVKVLLKHGCNVYLKDRYGKTALHYNAGNIIERMMHFLPNNVHGFRNNSLGLSNNMGQLNMPKEQPRSLWKRKIRMNFSSIVQNVYNDIDQLLAQMYAYGHVDSDNVNRISTYDSKDKTRKLLNLLLNKTTHEWISDFITYLQQSKTGGYLYQMIQATQEDLGECSPAELRRKLMQARTISSKNNILRESIRQNRSYLTNQLSRKTAGDVNLRMFTSNELEYITTRDDYRSKVEAAMMCLLGRQDSGWVLPFIRFMSAHLGKKCVAIISNGSI